MGMHKFLIIKKNNKGKTQHGNRMMLKKA